MSEILYDTKYSTVEINSSLGLNLTGDTTRIKHTGTSTFNIESTEGGISMQTSDTSNGIVIGTQNSVPVTIGNSSAVLTINSSSSTFDSAITVNGNINLNGHLADSNNNEILKISGTSSAVNEITFANAATGDSPTISATGSDTNVDLDFQAKGSGSYNFLGTSSNSAKIVLYEDTDNGTNTVTIQPPSSITTSYTLTLPSDDGTSGQYLKTNGSGTLSWGTVSGSSGYSRTVVNSSTYTVLDSDDIVSIRYTTTGACTVTLPAISSIGEIRIIIIDEGGNSSNNNITIAYATGNFLLGLNGSSNTYIINTDYGSVTLYNDNSTNWYLY